MEDRPETHSNQRALVLTLIFTAAETLFCSILLLRIPSDAKNAFLFGLSKERLLMLSGFGILFLLCLFLFIVRKKLYERFLSKKAAGKVFLCLTVFFTFFLLMPPYRFGKGAAYYTRIRPFLLQMFLASLSFLVFCSYADGRFSKIRETLGNLAQNKKSTLPFLLFFILTLVFVEITGLGKTPESSLWNKNGIPLQSIQLFTAVLFFVLGHKIGLFRFLDKRKRLLHFLIIWAVSAIIWSLAPFSDHFFAPGPYEPNLEFYPYSDAAGYDIAAQTALNGWGFNLGRVILKPTLVFIAFLSHLITGNDINRSMLVQSALFAVLPAVIYLFGSALSGTACGYLAAAFSLLKEWNALNTQTVLTINSRLIMSEFLTQILLAVFCYAVFRWLQKNGRELIYAVIAGGTVTLGVFTRYNFLAFLPGALLLLLIAFRNQFRKLLKPLLFFFLTMLLTALPLVYRESHVQWNLFQEFSYTVRKVLIKDRFSSEPEIDTSDTGPDNENKSNNQSLSADFEENQQIGPVAEENREFPGNENEDFNTSQITQDFSNINSTKNLTVFPSMINHGIHNFVTSVLTLPMELSFQDLEHLYTQDGDGLWRDDWQGDFSAGQRLFLAVWILLGAVTMGSLIKDHGIAGFSILYFWLVYCFSIGFSRSSGGRYVVPCNWIPMLLLAVCCTVLQAKGKLTTPQAGTETASVWKPILAMAAFLTFFTAMVLFENLLPSKNTSTAEGDLAILKEQLSEYDLDWNLAEPLLKSGIMHISHGVAVYPRFYYYQKGEHSQNGALMKKEFSRMTFTGINKENNIRLLQEYMLPHTELIHEFPQDSVFRALSCTSGFGYEDVLALMIETPEGETYTYVRDPLPEFTCPVPEPVCVEIDKCY
ncbi:MAG: hypothetical protein IJI07_04480 [Flexilinea sp.]|nr:hypothetical protein [Flexilinea sp.]